MSVDLHEYPRVPAMNDAQLVAAQGFFRDHDGEFVSVGGTYSASVRVSVFKDGRLSAAADITPDGRIFDHLLSEAA
jgi:hypothetical protein